MLRLYTSFSFLWGPWSHAKHLFSRDRLPFTLSYLASLTGTLYCAISVGPIPLLFVYLPDFSAASKYHLNVHICNHSSNCTPMVPYELCAWWTEWAVVLLESARGRCIALASSLNFSLLYSQSRVTTCTFRIIFIKAANC